MKFIYFLDGNKPFIVKLDVIDVNKLFLHEEIVKDHIESLVESFKTDKFLGNPVLVDGKTRVVLDGTHRVSAFRALGIKYIIAAVVDYFDDRIELKRWFRILRGDRSTIKRVLEDHEFYRTNIDKLSFNSENTIAVLMNDTSYVYQVNKKDIALYQRLSKIEKEFSNAGIKIYYVTEQEALKEWKRGRVVLITPLISKEDVISNAIRGYVYPPKTTRHIFPVRPIFIDFPVRFLRGDLEKDVIHEMLREHLLGKMYLKINGKITIDRFYEEEKLALFI